MKTLLALSALSHCLAAAVSAQAVTGSLQGRFLGAGGEPIAGVELTLRSDVIQGTRTTVTGGEGRFLFLALPAGIYALEARRIGYAPQRIVDIVLPLGARLSLSDQAMTPVAIRLDEIVVSGARLVQDLNSAATGIALDSARLRRLPGGRDFTSLLTLAPEGNPSGYGDGTTFGGVTGYDNAYFIDGIHATNPLSGDGSIRLPYNFIREVHLTTGGYEAQYGRSQGAVVNVVTNTGGNALAGEAVLFYSDRRLRAASRRGIAEPPADRFSHYDVGLSLGGPIRRDRLWFFAAYDPLVERKEVTFPGVTAQKDQLVRHLFAATLTWRPSPVTDASLSVIGDPTSRDAVEGAEAMVAPLATVTDPRAVLGSYRDGGWATMLRVRRTLGGGLLLNAALSHLTNLHQVAMREGGDDFASLARVDDFGADVTYGNFGRDYRVRTRRGAGELSLTIPASRHTIHLGASLEHNAVHLLESRQSNVWKNPDGSWQSYQADWSGRARNLVPTLFVQDAWEISQRFQANFGLRWEGQFISGRQGTVLSIADEFAPRLGLVFRPGALGTHRLYASAGRFYEQLPLWLATYLTMPYSQLDGVYPQNPLVDRTGGTEVPFTLDSWVTQVDQNVRGQHYDEITAGYEYRLDGAHRLGIRGTLRELRWALDAGVLSADQTDAYPVILGNPGRGALGFLPKGARRYSGLELTFERSGAGRLAYLFSYVLSRSYGNLPGQFDSDSRVPASHGSGQVAFPVWWVHATGYLPSDRRHLVKLSGVYQANAGLSLGLSGMFATGTPLCEFAGDPFFYFRTNVRQRGTNGRTPSLWTLDLRANYSLPTLAGRWRPQIVVNLSNLTNQRAAIDIEQLHYTDAVQSPNPNYLKVNRYQAPFSARVGIIVGF